jgi:hypothetical protein
VSRAILRGGAYIFIVRGEPARAAISGISGDLNSFTIGRPPEGIRRAFSFTGDLAFEALEKDALRLTDMKSKVSAGDGRFLLGPLSLDAFGGEGTGSFLADTSEKAPRYQLTLDVPRCRVENVLDGLRVTRLIGGEATLRMNVRATGRDKDELTQTLSGGVILTGSDLKTYDLDVDKLIKKFEKTRGFNLIDFAAFFIAGPLGPLATKGYDFGARLPAAQHGPRDARSAAHRRGIFEAGVAEAKDCALATKKNRVAFTGKIDLVKGLYQEARACRARQGRGAHVTRRSSPARSAASSPMGKRTMKVLAGPFIGMFHKIHHALDGPLRRRLQRLGAASHRAQRQEARQERRQERQRRRAGES